MKFTITEAEVNKALKGIDLPGGVELQGVDFRSKDILLDFGLKKGFFELDAKVGIKPGYIHPDGRTLRFQISEAKVLGISTKDILEKLLSKVPNITPFSDRLTYADNNTYYDILLPKGIIINEIHLDDTSLSIDFSLDFKGLLELVKNGKEGS